MYLIVVSLHYLWKLDFKSNWTL